MKEGESKVTFQYFDPTGKKPVEDLFEIPVREDISIGDLKEQLSIQLKQEKNIIIDPKFMRLRELMGQYPSRVFANHKLLKDVSSLYISRPVAITQLDEPETVKSEDDLVLFIVQFIPSKYEIGTRHELVVSDNMTVEQFKMLLSEKYGVKNVGIAKASKFYPGTDLLDIPSQEWDHVVPEYASSFKKGTLSTGPYYLRDGDIVYWRDNDEELKKLTDEEKKTIEKASMSKKSTRYYIKEEALTINAKA